MHVGRGDDLACGLDVGKLIGLRRTAKADGRKAVLVQVKSEQGVRFVAITLDSKAKG